MTCSSSSLEVTKAWASFSASLRQNAPDLGNAMEVKEGGHRNLFNMKEK